MFAFLLFRAFVILQNFDVSKIINEKGCLEATEEWIERNMISLATFGFIILFLQVSVLFCFYCFKYLVCVLEKILNLGRHRTVNQVSQPKF